MASTFDQANRIQRAIRNFAASDTGSRLFRPTAHRLDTLTLRLTRGRRTMAGLLTGIPTVMLTTTGARSGLARRVPVLGIPHPAGLAVIASNFGSTAHPAWYHNLRADPNCTVWVEGEEWSAIARLAEPDERDAIWEAGLTYYPGWRRYEVRAGDRSIQAFVLSRT